MSALGNDVKRLGFPQGEYKRCMDNSCYELNTETDTLTITSKGEIRSFYREDKAPQLIEKWGEEKARRFGILFGFLSVIIILILILVYIFRDRIGFSGNTLWYFILAAVGVVIYFGDLSFQYTGAVAYYKSSRCKNCVRNFALEELKYPLIKEVITPDTYNITITRYWKCKFCGNKDFRTEPLTYNSHKGEIDKKTKETCRICKKEFAMLEYRDPYVIKVGDVETTVRHYKCLNCGYREITIDKVVIKDVGIQ